MAITANELSKLTEIRKWSNYGTGMLFLQNVLAELNWSDVSLIQLGVATVFEKVYDMSFVSSKPLL